MHFLTKLGFSPRSNDTYEVGRIIILGCAIFLLIKKLEQTFHGSKMNTVAKNFKCSLYSFSDGKTIKKTFFVQELQKFFDQNLRIGVNLIF
jgi:CRISPR/Cas system Type II protein with McrA/HNH and RuvC-like nuclease domain